LKPRINFINLTVGNLEKAVRFYRDGLGWPTRGILGSEFHDDSSGADGTIAFFELQNGLMFGLYERTNLAKDASVPAGPPSSVEFSLGYATRIKEEVDMVLNKAEKSGAILTHPPRERHWGVYSGYFKDLDGHLSGKLPGIRGFLSMILLSKI
jgi:uncharacterized protein